jgi:predicted HTH transcriptional regulator
MRKAERFLIESLPVAGRIIPGKMEREDTPLLPVEALREALANAFVHRDYAIGGGSVSVALYDDRLEIISIGDLHFGLTPEALLRESGRLVRVGPDRGGHWQVLPEQDTSRIVTSGLSQADECDK